MKFLKSLFNFYINSSMHVALAVVSLACLFFLEFNLEVDFKLLCFIFFGSITGYNFVKYAEVAGLHHKSLARNLRLIQIFSFFSFLALIGFAFQQDFSVILASGFLGLLTLLYALPVFKGNNLRSLAGLKIFIISLVWGGVVVLLPFFASFPEISITTLALDFFQKMIFVLVITLPFEIRDLAYDETGLGTLPQQFGIKKTKLLGSFLLILILILEILNGFQVLNFLPVLIVCIAAGMFLINSEKDQSKYFASFWVEALPILWLLLWLVTNYFFLP
ncbi:hypothetical protein ACW6QP_14820 [Salegentibacter sp. HM20]